MSSSHGAILFLTSWYPVNTNPTHGIFIRNHALALSLYKKVIVVYAYSSEDGPFYEVDENVVNDNFTELKIKYSKPFLALKPFSSAIQYLKLKKSHHCLINYLKEKEVCINAIQVNVIFPAAVVLHEYKQQFNVPHAIMEHWSGYLKSDGNYKGGTLIRYTKSCVRSAKKIGYVSIPQKEAMVSNGLNGNYELIYNSVDTNLFSIKSKHNAKPRLLHVSSLVEREKNISGIFRSIKLLQNKGLDFEFVVVGGQPAELNEAMEMAKEMDIKNIQFRGVLNPAETAAEMQIADGLILFSNYEGMPVVVLEAMSCGLPVFCTKVGQLPYLIKEEFGCLVDVNNERQMADALEKFISNKINFNNSNMREFVLTHASYQSVGKQLLTLNGF